MQSSQTQIQALVLWRIITDKKLLPSGKTILILCSRIAPIARIFFVTCFGITEMTELTDFVSNCMLTSLLARNVPVAKYVSTVYVVAATS